MQKLSEDERLRCWTVKVHPSLIEALKRHRDLRHPDLTVSSMVRRILSHAAGCELRDGVLSDAD